MDKQKSTPQKGKKFTRSGAHGIAREAITKRNKERRAKKMESIWAKRLKPERVARLKQARIERRKSRPKPLRKAKVKLNGHEIGLVARFTGYVMGS